MNTELVDHNNESKVECEGCGCNGQSISTVSGFHLCKENEGKKKTTVEEQHSFFPITLFLSQ
eukprot:9130882-Ditylum_brightwellii.AAC.1